MGTYTKHKVIDKQTCFDVEAVAKRHFDMYLHDEELKDTQEDMDRIYSILKNDLQTPSKKVNFL